MTISTNIADRMLIDAATLKDWVIRVFVANSVPYDQADIIADCLVRADMKGVASHGVSRIPIYLKRLGLGLVRADARPKIIRETDSTGVVDAGDGFGHPAAMFGLRFAIERARRTGAGVAGIINSTHFGMAAHYGEIASSEDCVALVSTNSSPRMAPWGARDALFGTNPLAISVPGPTGPLVLDMATSAAALGRIVMAAAAGQAIPPGWALDREGRPTTDAATALGGTVVPMAGPKGSGLAFMLDVLCGALTGGEFGLSVRSLYRDMDVPEQCAHFMIVINVAAFIPVEQFRAAMTRYVSDFKACRPAEGIETVYLPGEIEQMRLHRALAEGVPIELSTLQALQEIATATGIALPS